VELNTFEVKKLNVLIKDLEEINSFEGEKLKDLVKV
jgi:hypothetical protein